MGQLMMRPKWKGKGGGGRVVCVCDEGGLRTVCGREETGWLRGVVGREGEVKRALVHTLSVVIAVCA